MVLVAGQISNLADPVLNADPLLGVTGTPVCLLHGQQRLHCVGLGPTSCEQQRIALSNCFVQSHPWSCSR